jgi:hypothetical protein
VGKLSLPSPLLCLRGHSRLTTGVAGFNASGRPCAPLYPFGPSTILSLPPSLCLKKERGERRERKRRKIGKNTRISMVLPSLHPETMVEQD